MKKYKVSFTKVVSMEVNANSMDEAEEGAIQFAEIMDWNKPVYNEIEVEEINNGLGTDCSVL